jgi:outer membrane cobalamin receptor
MGRMATGLRALMIGMMLAGCGVIPRGAELDSASPASGAANLITRAEIDRSQWGDIYELVRNLRPRWVQSRGTDSVLSPGEVQVYVDGVRLGGVHRLRAMPTSGIDHLEWVDGVTASGRWGFNHGQGVIAVSYRPR